MGNVKFLNKKYEAHKHKFIFGATTATIVNLGLIVGFGYGVDPRMSIISGILVVALADNLTDSLGIHIYQESQAMKKESVWLSTFFNFFTRLFISLVFAGIIFIFPLSVAIWISIIFGLLMLSIISYIVARQRKINSAWAIIEHLLIAGGVIAVSYYLGKILAVVIK